VQLDITIPAYLVSQDYTQHHCKNVI